MSSIDPFVEIATKRTQALIDSLNQTYKEIEEKAIKDHPNDPPWLIRLAQRIAWNNLRF